MQTLRLLYTELTGTISFEMNNNKSNWKEIMIWKTNIFSGSLSTHIGRMTDLFLLDIRSNELTGTLPSEIGLLSSSLEEFHVGGNQLHGERSSYAEDLPVSRVCV